MVHFFQFVLRTTDVAAAAAFYTSVLGRDDAEIFQLHESAVARGATPHWLGFLDVSVVADVDATATAFAARGGVPLGPKWVNGQGLEAAVMRDPGGAVVALAKPSPTQGAVPRPEVAWHLLNSVDVERSKTAYAELFGWEFKSAVDRGRHGVFHPFSWQPGGPAVGSLSDIAGRPGVHPHWLFHFQVPALDRALEAVRAGGGVVIGPFTLPGDDRIAICDDPQGAAFALIERRG